VVALSLSPLGERVPARSAAGEGAYVVKYTYSSGKRSLARRMRREPTDAERKLWFLLRDRRFGSAKFRRQVLVGRYGVDFICLRLKLIVEADGGQHSENAADATRDEWLASEGYKSSVTATSISSRTLAECWKI
jgi:very-short-patch-repair endonuclease